MITQNLHTHTNYCDGKFGAAAMAAAALEQGLTSLGFSEHAYVPFDPVYSITHEAEKRYIGEIRALQAEYAGRLDILLGLEADALCPHDRGELDYMIGSLHYLPYRDGYLPCEGSPRDLRAIVKETYAGDGLRAAAAYYDMLCGFIERERPDICGHFDVITKVNHGLFDEDSPAYRDMAFEALYRIEAAGAVIEVNTGAMARGYKTLPYPAPFILKRMKEKNMPLTVSSDAHHTDTITYAFSDTRSLLINIGFKSIYVLRGGKWVETEL